MKVHPTPSYSLELPSDVRSEVEGRVSSYWREGSDILLQVSSYKRESGPQVGAMRRLDDRLSKGHLTGVRTINLQCEGCEDVACKIGFSPDGLEWIYCYAVWPHLAVFGTVSGKQVGESDAVEWALDALRSLRPSAPTS
jgi:hypothetical protein